MNISTLGWAVSRRIIRRFPTISRRSSRTDRAFQRSVNFTIKATSTQIFESELKEQRPSPGGPWTLATLPDDVKKELVKQVAIYSHLPGQSGREDAAPSKAPPPPR